MASDYTKMFQTCDSFWERGGSTARLHLLVFSKYMNTYCNIIKVDKSEFEYYFEVYIL